MRLWSAVCSSAEECSGYNRVEYGVFGGDEGVRLVGRWIHAKKTASSLILILLTGWTGENITDLHPNVYWAATTGLGPKRASETLSTLTSEEEAD